MQVTGTKQSSSEGSRNWGGRQGGCWTAEAAWHMPRAFLSKVSETNVGIVMLFSTSRNVIWNITHHPQSSPNVAKSQQRCRLSVPGPTFCTALLPVLAALGQEAQLVASVLDKQVLLVTVVSNGRIADRTCACSQEQEAGEDAGAQGLCSCCQQMPPTPALCPLSSWGCADCFQPSSARLAPSGAYSFCPANHV